MNGHWHGYLVIVMMGCLASTVAKGWQPADGPLVTAWTENVSPESVWPEYPRPQMRRPQWVNLNGLWQYAIRPADESRPANADGSILVPFPVESSLSGVRRAVSPGERLWYWREFETADHSPDKKWLLHFGAVDWKCTIWVNGTQVGEHTGGYDPFYFDISEALRGGTNELAIAVWDPTDDGYQPRGKQVLKPGGIMYTAVTGIWQTVWLEQVPREHIRGLKIVPDVDRGLLQVTVDAPETLQVQLTARDDGQVCAQAQGTANEAAALKLDNARLWSPDRPHLYDLQVQLVRDGQVMDTVESYFGMRKIELRKDEQGIPRLFLNNRVLFQYGPLDQGWWPDGLYLPASDEALKYDIEMTKKYGMNMARKHVKYEPARWYYWCDRLGLLVWQDMPSGDAGRNGESRANYRRELQAMIDALHHFPSIIMWVPFNEGWGQHATPEVVAWIENYDPSRLVNEASGWTDEGSGHISDMHSYPGPGMRPVEDRRAQVLGEFGGLGLPVSGHTWQDEKNWGYRSYETQQALTEAYLQLLHNLRPLIGQGLCAAVYTQTSDVEIEVNGLMTYDRAVQKIDVGQAAEAARKLYLPPPTVKTLVATSQSEPQSWRYTLTQPGDDWVRPAFDDSAWDAGQGGFGTRSTPGAVVGTEWNRSDIWLRRKFELSELPTDGQVCLLVHHDEDAEVFVNGLLVKSCEGYTTSYVTLPLPADAATALQAGENTLAVHCRQTDGGQFIDVGLVLLLDAEPSVSFRKIQLTDGFHAESAAIGDINRDGHTDVIYGPYWYQGPDFSQAHEIYPAERFDPHGYSNNFITIVSDINEDGWPDLLVHAWPGKEFSWFENPKNQPGHWTRHLAHPVVDNESPTFGDLLGDGRPALIFHTNGTLGYARPRDARSATTRWPFEICSVQEEWGCYTHGLGFGDVDGDGRADFLMAGGWWQQPAESQGQPWKKHAFPFGTGGAQMHVYDVDGDGLNDVITSLAAHAYGLSWFQQVRDGEQISFVEHRILPDHAEGSLQGVQFSQPHAVEIADVNGDGLSDIITGKRYWAHGPAGDPDSQGAAVLYWFELQRHPDGRVTFTPHRIDEDSGVGTQFSVGDVNGDGHLDVVIGNKKGAFIFLQERL